MSNLPMIRPQNLGELMQFAGMISKSEMVPKDYRNKPENIVVAVQWGYEVGLSPIQALRNISIINGRPAIWGDAALALVRASGLLESFDERVENGVATCTVKRKGEPAQSRSFSELEAKRAGLLNKQGPWSQYPQRMLQMRARSWALRDIFTDVLNGISTVEEAADMEPEDPAQATRVQLEAQPEIPVIAAPVQAVEEAEIIELASEQVKAEILAKVQQIGMSRDGFQVLLNNRQIKWKSLTAQAAADLRKEIGSMARQIEAEKNAALSAEFEASRGGAA